MSTEDREPWGRGFGEFEPRLTDAEVDAAMTTRHPVSPSVHNPHAGTGKVHAIDVMLDADPYADLVGVWEIADRLNVKKTIVTNWVHRTPTNGFPAPAFRLHMGPVYRWSAIEAWWKGYVPQRQKIKPGRLESDVVVVRAVRPDGAVLEQNVVARHLFLGAATDHISFDALMVPGAIVQIRNADGSWT